MKKFNFYIQLWGGKRIPFIHYNVADGTPLQSKCPMDKEGVKELFTSRHKIQEMLGNKFIANRGTDYEREVTPNDIFIEPATQFDWKRFWTFCLSMFTFMFLVYAIKEHFLIGLKMGGITVAIIYVFASLFMLKRFDERRTARQWNRKFVRLDGKTEEEIENEKIQQEMAAIPLTEDEDAALTTGIVLEMGNVVAKKPEIFDALDKNAVKKLLKKHDATGEEEIEMPD